MIRRIIKAFQTQYYRIKNRKKDVCIRSGCRIGGKDTIFEGKNRLGENTTFHGSMGYGSYIGSNCIIDGRIGKYCSISDNVHTIIGNHPTEKFVSTHPAFFSTKMQAGFTYTDKQLFDESVFADDRKNQIIVGNDVWIGFGVTIFSGVRIGDGAVIAAGAIVNKDVPPFAIVGGIPAKLIKKRFSDDQINQLQKIKWWEWDTDKIQRMASDFVDIDKFLDTQR